MQAAHAAHEAGILFGDVDQTEPSSIVLIGVKNKSQLEKALAHTTANGFKTVEFHEPDFDMGFSAFATSGVVESQKHLFKKFQLWRA